MPEKKIVNALVVGGGATAGPPLGPALGPLGLNVMMVVNEINKLTKGFAGMRVPVMIAVDLETKAFEVEVGIPTASALIVKEGGIQKGSGTPKATKVGNLTMEQIRKIAELKLSQSYAASPKAVALEILGSCVSMGVTVEGRDARSIIEEVHRGAWDEVLGQG